jgi:branched-chain amino acid transport system substrate-binding protein
MDLHRFTRQLALCAALSALVAPAAAEDVIRIGVLSDMSGPYSDIAGKGSVAAAQLAVEEFGGSVGGRRIEIVSADHQNKPDLGSATARRWFDNEGVDVIVDVITSSVALAVQHIAREKDKIVIFSGAGADRLAGDSCTPNSFVWSWDTYALANVAVQAFARENLKDWYLIEVDYALGHALEEGVRGALGRAGGKVVGVSRHPLGTSDFSSYLLQGQGSGAPVIALLNGGADAVNALKQAGEFQITQGGKQIVSLAMLLNDVKAVGLKDAQGLRVTESFYWDLDDLSRAWSARYGAKMGGSMPSMIQAGTYSAVRHYLRAVEKAGTKATGDVTAAMRALPVEDATVSAGAHLRADGRLMRDFYAFRVKRPTDSRGAWDLYEKVATIPAEEAAVPATQSACPLLKGQ